MDYWTSTLSVCPKGFEQSPLCLRNSGECKGDLDLLKTQILRNCDRGISVRASRPKAERQGNGCKTTKTVKESSFYDAVRRSLKELSLLPMMGQMKRSKRFRFKLSVSSSFTNIGAFGCTFTFMQCHELIVQRRLSVAGSDRK